MFSTQVFSTGFLAAEQESELREEPFDLVAEITKLIKKCNQKAKKKREREKKKINLRRSRKASVTYIKKKETN